MSIERSRTAHPVVDDPRGLTMGSWAMWITLTALSTGIAGLLAAGLYLHSGQPAWPPAELSRPSPLPAWLMIGGTTVAAVLTHRAKVLLRAAKRQGATTALLVAGAVATAVVLTAAADVATAGFRWDVHAYASIYWILTLSAAVFVAVGVLMLAAVAVQRLIGVVDEDRMLELEVTSGYLWWSIPAVVSLLAVVHLLPDPSGGTAAALATSAAQTTAWLTAALEVVG